MIQYNRRNTHGSSNLYKINFVVSEDSVEAHDTMTETMNHVIENVYVMSLSARIKKMMVNR